MTSGSSVVPGTSQSHRIALPGAWATVFLRALGVSTYQISDQRRMIEMVEDEGCIYGLQFAAFFQLHSITQATIHPHHQRQLSNLFFGLCFLPVDALSLSVDFSKHLASLPPAFPVRSVIISISYCLSRSVLSISRHLTPESSVRFP